MFRYKKNFFILSNFILCLVTFLLIYACRYTWSLFPGIGKRPLSWQTFLFFSLYSLTIILFNISLKVYEINKISQIKESILYNVNTALFSMAVFGVFFYVTKIQFARFVFFSGFFCLPFLISFYNKIIFNLLISKKKTIQLLYFGSQTNFSLFSQLVDQYQDLFSIQIKKIFLTDHTDDLEAQLKQCHYLIIDSDQNFSSRQFEILNDFEIRGGRIYSLIDLFSYLDQSLPAEIIANNSHFELFSSYKLDSIYNKKIKRVVDIFIAVILLLLFLPLLILIALLIKLTAPGKIFYIQKRVGLKGREFNMIKFRTMYESDLPDDHSLTMENDLRITRIGKILRPLRLDEFPQLFNILKGEMSFIGPRPERKNIIEMIIKKYPLFNKRLLIKPGLTGWAQVKYQYINQIQSMNKKLSYDLFYINNLSLLFDIKILLYTIETVVFKRGAI